MGVQKFGEGIFSKCQAAFDSTLRAKTDHFAPEWSLAPCDADCFIQEDEKKKKKKKKKIKLEMHDQQVFKDGEEYYVWIYDPVPLKTFFIGLLLGKWTDGLFCCGHFFLVHSSEK